MDPEDADHAAVPPTAAMLSQTRPGLDSLAVMFRFLASLTTEREKHIPDSTAVRRSDLARPAHFTARAT